MVRPNTDERKPVWLGDSLKNLCSFPDDVQDALGFDLSKIQHGKTAMGAKTLAEFGSSVVELKDDYDTDTYRVILALGMKKGIYVLHAFMKKSKSGRGIPRQDKEIIRRRLKTATAADANPGE